MWDLLLQLVGGFSCCKARGILVPWPGIKLMSPALQGRFCLLCCYFLQSWAALCNPMDCSPPGSSVHGILQVRILEWVAMPSSRRSSQPRDRTQMSHVSYIGSRFFTTSSIWKAQFSSVHFSRSECFPMSQFFAPGSQSIEVSASASVLPMNTQDWSPLGWTGWSSLQSKGLSRVFSNTTVQKHQFFGAQLSSKSNSHIHTWPLEKS